MKSDVIEVREALQKLYEANPSLKAYSESKKPEMKRILHLLYASNADSFLEELEQYNALHSQNLTEKDFEDTKIRDILPKDKSAVYSYFNDFDFEGLPIAKKIGIEAPEGTRVITVFDKKNKFLPLPTKNDYVLQLDTSADFSRYLETPPITQAQARKIKKDFQKKGKDYYLVIPRVYAIAMGYKPVKDTMNVSDISKYKFQSIAQSRALRLSTLQTELKI